MSGKPTPQELTANRLEAHEPIGRLRKREAERVKARIDIRALSASRDKSLCSGRDISPRPHIARSIGC